MRAEYELRWTQHADSNTVSHYLTVRRAEASDFGTYTCKPQYAASASLLVQITGERPIALPCSLGPH